jgi:hypothetical protein
VCGRWRSVVFGSPRHLKLQLVCTAKTRARDRLDVWPALPLIVRCNSSNPKAKVRNIVAALERRDRVRRINLLSLWRSHWEQILAAMQEPFPELTHLNLSAAEEGPMSVLPDSFLGGFSPRLRNLKLSFTPFRDYRNYFCLPPTSPLFRFGQFLIPGTFRPTRWPLPFPRRPASNHFYFISYPVDLTLTGIANVRLC